METENINPFIESVAEVFGNMLETDIKRDSTGIANDFQQDPDVIGIIGLSGTAQGIAALTFPVKTALAVVGRMVGMSYTTVDASVIDGVGELINIIAGNAKAKYAGHKIKISLPTVVRGRMCSISKTESTVDMTVPFDSALGHFSLTVAFRPTLIPEKETTSESTGG